MDAAAQVDAPQHYDNRQNNDDGQAERTGHIAPYPLMEYINFRHCMTMTARVIAKASPVNVENLPDGTAFCAEVTLTDNALKFLGIELWYANDVRERADMMRIAATTAWAEATRLKLVDGSKEELRILSDLIGEPPTVVRENTSRQSGPTPEAGRSTTATSLGDDLRGEEGADEEHEHVGGAGGGGTGQQGEATGAGPLGTPLPATPPLETARGQLHTLVNGAPDTPEAETKDDTQVVTTRAVTESLKIDRFRVRLQARLRAIQEGNPNCLALLMEGRDPAPLARAHIHVLHSIDAALDRQIMLQAAVHAMGTYEDDRGVGAGQELLLGLNDANRDRTFADLWPTLTSEPNTLERVYGIIPMGSLFMAAAREQFSPRTAEASIALGKVATEISFVDSQGVLEFVTPAGKLRTAVGNVTLVQAACNWDAVTRNVIAALAVVSKDTYSVSDEKGMKHRFGDWALGHTLELQRRGLGATFDQAYLEGMTTDLVRFARLHSREKGIIESVHSTATSRGGHVYRAAPTNVYSAAIEDDEDPFVGQTISGARSASTGCKPGCTNMFLDKKVICFKCFGTRPHAWKCKLCKLLSAPGSVRCGRWEADGCTGVEAEGTQPTAGYLRTLVKACEAGRAARANEREDDQLTVAGGGRSAQQPQHGRGQPREQHHGHLQRVGQPPVATHPQAGQVFMIQSDGSTAPYSTHYQPPLPAYPYPQYQGGAQFALGWGNGS
jgi:hypothetical protein